MRPDSVGLGGFDSHALPPRSGATTRLRPFASFAAACLILAGCAASGHAQRSGDARVGVADTLRAPLTPGRAFFYSAAIPGLSQAKLGRPMVGIGFFLVEAFAVAMIHRSTDDLRLARAYRGDSVPLTYKVDASGVVQLDARGNAVVDTWQVSQYSDALIRARRLQVEDWSAVLVFNHLISGAEAFVAAQLWDLPQHVSLRAVPLRGGGIGLSGSLRTP
jgi:hypothetical protein